MSALPLPGLSPEPRCVDNRGISSRFQSRIATVIHITEYDLTNCTRSEPFVASWCGGLWSALTPRPRQGPSSRYCPEIATVPASPSRPASHSTRLRPVGVLTPRHHSPPASGGRPLLDTAKKLPHRHQVPPDPGPSPQHGARPRPVGVQSSRDLEAPDTHQRARTLYGREWGRAGADPARSQPRHPYAR